jgi:hypothetical protein
MEKHQWGDRGDFRKVTVTLPPEVYDALVHESARRKSAGDPNHLLSAIAREWFAQRQPLLPIENTELRVYRAADAQQPWFYPPSIYNFTKDVGADNPTILTDLLVDLAGNGWLVLEKWSDTGQYVALKLWKDAETFFYQGSTVRMQVTIPGRRRKEALEIKERQTTAAGGVAP